MLAHGAVVLASHNVPESIDLVSLSAHALEMLAAMRQSAARMGIGAVPAVYHPCRKGPITVFHQDDLVPAGDAPRTAASFRASVRSSSKSSSILSQGDPCLLARRRFTTLRIEAAKLGR